jgi:hypothetical protein
MTHVLQAAIRDKNPYAILIEKREETRVVSSGMQRRRNMLPAHLQGRIISQAGNQHETGSSDCYLLHSGFLFGLFFDCEY